MSERNCEGAGSCLFNQLVHELLEHIAYSCNRPLSFPTSMFVLERAGGVEGEGEVSLLFDFD